MVNRFFLLLLGAALVGCVPDLDDRTFLVDEPRILAIQAEPAEVAPGEEVRYRLLWAGGDPEAPSDTLAWGHCNLRKPLAELGPVHPGCLSGDPSAVEPLGTGTSVVGRIPRQACRRFGPDTPEPVAGEPSGRPVDPDSSGGFYQPVVVSAEAEAGTFWSIGSTRISCGVAGATPAQLSELARTYVANENPALERVLMRRQGAAGPGQEPKPEPETLHPSDPPAGANIVAPGETVVLRASLPACDQAPCAGAEPYVFFDPRARSIEHARESIRFAWFADSGYFEFDRGGGDPGQNTWTAPTEPGVARIWIVVRDERGGVGWEEYFLRVVAPAAP